MERVVLKEYTDIQMEQITALYHSVGWTNYTTNPSMLAAAVRNSLKIIIAYEGERLIGLIRVVGDGYSILYIQDLIVRPEYQRHGIGKLLLQEVERLYPSVYQKVLLTDCRPQSVGFYESCGFSASEQYQCAAFVKFSP